MADFNSLEGNKNKQNHVSEKLAGDVVTFESYQ